MWELVCNEGWALKNWCLQTVVLEKTLESPLNCKEIKSGNCKRNQPWIFIRRTDAETLILWPPDPKSQLIGKDLDAGKDWRWEERGVTEDEMLGWHDRLNGHELEQTRGDSGGQRAWWATVYGVSKSETRLSNWTSPVRCRNAASITIQPYPFPPSDGITVIHIKFIIIKIQQYIFLQYIFVIITLPSATISVAITALSPRTSLVLLLADTL